MTAIIEAFADMTCPFTHVGLKVVMTEIHRLDHPPDLRVRAWPLEWVNGSPVDAGGVSDKVEALRTQLGTDYFPGFRQDRWPDTTIPALNLAEAAYQRDNTTGAEVSLRLRSLLFEEGENIADLEVLARIADAFGLPTPGTDAVAGVRADYDEGKRRGVRGSPDFWIEGREFFCPALDLGHDADGSLKASFDGHGIRRFVRSIETTP